MKFKGKKLAVAAMMVMMGYATSAFAGGVPLVDVLENKGMLSADEAEIARQAEGRGIPSWIYKTHLKGDLRLRNELKKKVPGHTDNRQRLRFRLGLTSVVNERVKIGFGLASGSSDSPTSTNQTLEQEFQSKAIWLDYAYAKYRPIKWITFEGGKFKSPFFHTDMLWDSDIRFDGFAAKLSHKPMQNMKLFLTGGYFPMDHRSGKDDIFLTAGQAGGSMKFGDAAKFKVGLAYYDFVNIKGYPIASIAEGHGTNVATASGAMAHDFRIFSPTAKLIFPDPVGMGVPVTLFGEYADNTAVSASRLNDAWRGGIQLGHKAHHTGDWRLIAQYSKVESDVFFDSFPDSDFNGGGTNAKGYEIILDYALAKGVIFGLDYYNTHANTGPKANEQLFQADLIFKF